jgi:hypothetical protein
VRASEIGAVSEDQSPSSSCIAHRRLGSAIRVLRTMTADPAELPKSSTMTPLHDILTVPDTRAHDYLIAPECARLLEI